MDNRPNERLLRAAWRLEHQAAQLTTNALHAIHDRMQTLDGWPARGGEPGRSSDTTSSTERAALNRADIATDQREELRDRLDGILLGIDSYIAFCRGIIGHGDDRQPVILCGDYRSLDLRPWEGHQLVWTPHSRDERNGWQDPTCRQTAGRTGLCPRCLQRMNRWRRDNGLHWISDAPDEAAS